MTQLHDTTESIKGKHLAADERAHTKMGQCPGIHGMGGYKDA
ncbi:hypothetical protein [Salinicoccus albus]|nr:hypothetical protein [Salinicoccus albus]